MKVVKNRGFTLLEVLVVVIIIGILAALVLPRLRLVVKRSKGSEAFINLGALVAAEKRYIIEHGNPTPNIDDLDIENLNDDDLYPNRHFNYSFISWGIPRKWAWKAGYIGGSETISLTEDGVWGGTWPWLPGGG